MIQSKTADAVPTGTHDDSDMLVQVVFGSQKVAREFGERFERLNKDGDPSSSASGGGVR